mmetsp:Transcript_45383/g.105979  ORF Transcript_45383/g.105979 Transcript_45383/m.105979 type:complete len:276 (-) Transcript_45383:414-1241(-)
MASASCMASSPSSSASAMSTSSTTGTGVVSVSVGTLSGRGGGGASGVVAGGFATGVVTAAVAAASVGIDMARAASSKDASSNSPPLVSVSIDSASAAPSVLLGAAPPASDIAPSLLLCGSASPAPDASLSPSEALAASASCRARSSSIEMRSAYANSGSMLGSTPNSAKPSPPPPPVAAAAATAAAAPSSPWMIGEERRISDSTCGPGGTVTRWLLSSELTALRSASSFAAFSASSPKLIMSTATEFFLSFLPSFTNAASSSLTGLPTKTIMRCR